MVKKTIKFLCLGQQDWFPVQQRAPDQLGMCRDSKGVQLWQAHVTCWDPATKEKVMTGHSQIRMHLLCQFNLEWLFVTSATYGANEKELKD